MLSFGRYLSGTALIVMTAAETSYFRDIHRVQQRSCQGAINRM
jgi:hypothetical protein